MGVFDNMTRVTFLCDLIRMKSVIGSERTPTYFPKQWSKLLQNYSVYNKILIINTNILFFLFSLVISILLLTEFTRA